MRHVRLRLPIVGRWFVLGSMVGVAAGIAAIVFFYMLHFSTYFFLEYIVGSESSIIHGYAEDVSSRWMLLIIPAVGALVSGIIVAKFAPEAQGAGTDAVLKAIHNKNGYINPKVPIVKLFASSIIIGAGGSGGREGPIAQVSAGISSYICNFIKLTDREKRIITACGMGAGIGATFKSPLAGAIFAAEVLYSSSDMEYEALLPTTIASIISYSVYCSVVGWDPLFAINHFEFQDPLELIPYAILGVSCAFVGRFYVFTYKNIKRMFERSKLHPYVRPAVGGIFTGLIGFMVPQALAGGYGVIGSAINLEFSLLFLVLLLFAKILTTSFTVGSGGSAGLFGPSMVIGASVGAIVGVAMESIMPGLILDRGSFAVVGMAGLFTAIANAPLSTIIMISEMTGNYNLLVPTMWVSAIAFLVMRSTSIYSSQVPHRQDSPMHKGEFFLEVLKLYKVRDVMKKEPIVISETMKFFDVVKFISKTKHNNFPVINSEKRYVGILSYENIRHFVFEEGLEDIVIAGEICDKNAEVIFEDQSLADAIEAIGLKDIEMLPVVDRKKRDVLLGVITRRDIIAMYNKAMKAQKKIESEDTSL